jgi:hypothetical protein
MIIVRHSNRVKLAIVVILEVSVASLHLNALLTALLTDIPFQKKKFCISFDNPTYKLICYYLLFEILESVKVYHLTV